MNIKIYADGSKIEEILDAYENDKSVKGFTTNPTLMNKAGVTDYVGFVKEVTSKITDLPISFEIFADELDEMEEQVKQIASFGDNVFVKIPVMNTKGEPTYSLIDRVTDQGVKVNVTAVFTKEQVDELHKVLNPDVESIISIFAGRIADTGVNPLEIVKDAVDNKINNCEILWASTRTVYNIYEADRVGCDIITAPPEILKKLSIGGKDLTQYSLETVKMFYNDANSAGYKL